MKIQSFFHGDSMRVAATLPACETTLGHGLGTDYKAVSGVFDAVHIGTFTFRDVWAPGTPNAEIGMEMLRRFTMTFDVAHHVLYLQPNRRLTEPVPAPGE